MPDCKHCILQGALSMLLIAWATPHCMWPLAMDMNCLSPHSWIKEQTPCSRLVFPPGHFIVLFRVVGSDSL